MSTVYAIGIDFGTANSCVAYASYFDRDAQEVDPDPLHRPEVIPFYGKDTIPTAIHLGDGRGVAAFGQAAEEKATFDPSRFFTGFKLHLGREDTGTNAFLLTRHFLTYLRRRVAEFVPLDGNGANHRIETIVGHPVQWNADQREATLRAVQEAGFPNVRLEEESLAALYCHIFDERTGFRPRPNSYVMTIDMGGGTTDFAFLQVPGEANQPPVSIPVHPTPEGARSYGGRDLDLLLFSYLSRGWDQTVVKEQGRLLLREIRRFKEAFSNNLADGAFEYQAVILVGEKPHRVRMTRAEFESIAANYINHYEVLVRGALAEAQLRPDQVAHLILTGGHSRWYFVERTLGRVFPHLFVGQRTIFRHSHPEQSVARGLAYDPLVRSSKGGFLAPVRRAAHPVWLDIPGSSSAKDGEKQAPVLLLPRGQLLPFSTQRPLRFQIEQVAGASNESRVKLRFLSGQQQLPLADRVATFQRGFWEQVATSLVNALPWAGNAKTDRFDVQVHFEADEHELIMAELAVTRFIGNKAVDVQRQKLQANLSQVVSRDSL
jgi:molecular chaperone DnaK (HSP70)